MILVTIVHKYVFFTTIKNTSNKKSCKYLSKLLSLFLTNKFNSIILCLPL